MKYKALIVLIFIPFIFACKPENEMSNSPKLEEGSISLIAPNGSEKWQAGTNQLIKWQSKGIDSVKIDYSIDNGASWIFVALNKTNSGSFSWNPVPDTPTPNARVKISDAGKGSIFSISSNSFSITAHPAISITKPAGGEIWYSGTSQQIKWTSSGITGVAISYSSNMGLTWSIITSYTQSNGIYLWENIPACGSGLCKIKIADAADPENYAISEGKFSIIPPTGKSITITSPAGGEVLFPYANYEIKWNSSSVQMVNLYFSPDMGITYNPITGPILNEGKYIWQVPELNSNLCKILIRDADDSSIYYESGGTFTINSTKYLTVTYPVGGEKFTAGDSVTIYWRSAGCNFVSIQLSVSPEGMPRVWNDIVLSTPNAGSYKTAFNAEGNNCFIKVSSAQADGPSDENDIPFEIIKNNSLNKGIISRYK